MSVALLRLPVFLFGIRVEFLADEQRDDIRILLDGAGLPQVAQARFPFAVAGPVFRVTV